MAVERSDSLRSLPSARYPDVGPRYFRERRVEMLRFHTLGSFELLEGRPPAVRLIPTQPKRLALLAYLALAQPRGFHRRDTILALFWPELSGEEARRALSAWETWAYEQPSSQWLEITATESGEQAYYGDGR